MSLALNFVASKIAEDALLRCIPDTSDHQQSKGAVVIGNIEDDFHSLGQRTLGLFLTAAGWEVHDLGNNIPAEEFLQRNSRIFGLQRTTLASRNRIPRRLADSAAGRQG